MAERDPRCQIRRVPGAPLKYQNLDLLRGNPSEEVAIDERQLHRQDVAVYVPDRDPEVHPQQSP